MHANNSLKWLYIDFNSYFASVEQQMHPALRGKPIAVIPVESDYTCAIAASYEAKAFGISTGTMVGEAKKLCPELICVMARHDHYVEFHHKLLAEIDRHIPVEKVHSIDECACILLGKECDEAEARALAQRIKNGIAKNVGEFLRCSIGISSNRYLAKIASNMQKPNGLMVLRQHEICECIGERPIEWLTGIGANMGKRLRMNGIGTIAQLYGTEARQLRRIWGGVLGERFWHLLHGDDLPELKTKRSSVGHSHVLGGEWRPISKAKNVARRLTCKAASRLRRLGYLAGKMTISVRVENGPRLAYETSFGHCNDSFTFLAQLKSIWEQMIAEHRIARIKKISIVFHGLVEVAQAQNDLFEQLDQNAIIQKKRQQNLSLAMDKINEKYGRDSLVVGELPRKIQTFSGTKIAFNRIPDMEEFWE